MTQKTPSLSDISPIGLLGLKISTDPIKLRNLLDLNDCELARLLRVASRTVQYWVAGESNPSKMACMKAGYYIRDSVLLAKVIEAFIEHLNLVILLLQCDQQTNCLSAEMRNSFSLELRYVMNILSGDLDEH